MQHGKHGHQEPTAVIPNCNIPFFKTYFAHKTRKQDAAQGTNTQWDKSQPIGPSQVS